MRKTYQVEFYRSGFLRKWRWRVTADNGKIVGASSQGYYNLSECEDNIELLKGCFINADFIYQK